MLIIKRITAVSAALCVCLMMLSQAYAEPCPNVSAKSAVIMHEGELLYEKNADMRLPMASTTKIMTAILAIENCAPDAEYEIAAEHCGIEGSSMYLKSGESYTVRELITGLMLASGNDAASALASIVSGSTEAFVELMNKKAQELRMKDTHFTNPHGLPEENHYSTARDMARLMEYCMDNAAFAEIAGLKTARIKNLCFTNHNKLLTMNIGCTGGKTGYTMASGRCLVSCCERDGLRLCCATLCAPDDWNDHISLYDMAYSAYERRNLSQEAFYVLPVISGESESVLVRPEKEIYIFARRDEEFEYVYELPRFVFAPVKALDRAGRVIIKRSGAVLTETELLFCDDVRAKSQ